MLSRNARLYGLRAEARAFAACLADETLDAAVPTCPGWTLGRLARHLASVHRWAETAAGSTAEPPRPRLDWPQDAEAMSDALMAGVAMLTTALDAAAATPAWSFAPGFGTVGFWQRRQLVETAIHRWDAENTLGRAEPVGDDVAAEGLDELAEVLVPLRLSEGHVAGAAAIELVAEGVGRWRVLAGEPVATASGSASDLLLACWGRLDAAAPGLTWSGDREAGEATLRGPLTP